jgi:hypothetical protein
MDAWTCHTNLLYRHCLIGRIKYPPYDEDDVAVLDGGRPGQDNLPLAITNRPGNHSCLACCHVRSCSG